MESCLLWSDWPVSITKNKGCHSWKQYYCYIQLLINCGKVYQLRMNVRVKFFPNTYTTLTLNYRCFAFTSFILYHLFCSLQPTSDWNQLNLNLSLHQLTVFSKITFFIHNRLDILLVTDWRFIASVSTYTRSLSGIKIDKTYICPIIKGTLLQCFTSSTDDLKA